MTSRVWKLVRLYLSVHSDSDRQLAIGGWLLIVTSTDSSTNSHLEAGLPVAQASHNS